MDPHANRGDRRAILIAFALLLLIAPVTFQIAIARIPTEVFFGFGAGVPAMVPLVVLLALTGLMGVGLLRRAGLTRRELLIIYTVLLVGVPLGTRGILFYTLPKVPLYHYMLTLHPEWERSFGQHIPSWWGPTDAGVLESFLYGGSRVQWSAWAVPLLAWGSFMLCLVASVSCISILFRRQWVTNERLTFPVAQIPLEMLRDSEGSSQAGRLTTRRVFWLGAGISFLITFVHSLSARVAAIPYIPLVFVLMPERISGPLVGLGEIRLALPPFIIALLYLLPKEILFSAWCLWLAHLWVNVLTIAAGFNAQQGAVQQRLLPAEYQGLGAAFALTFWVFWIGRRHLLAVVRSAFARHQRGEEKAEAGAYRWALLGFLVSFGWMVCFCWLSGCRFLVAFVFIALIVGYFVFWARLRAETGLGFLSYPMDISFAMMGPVGAGFYRPREIVTFITMRWATFVGGGETLELCSGNVLESYKIADSAGINWRRITAILGAGFVLALAAGIFVTMTGLHQHGYFETDAGRGFFWPSLYSRLDGGVIDGALVNPGPAHGSSSVIAIVFGAGVALLLGVMRLRFWWWPLHPVGYLLTTSYGMVFMLF
ncbi:MAG: hypothetical protein MUQ26_01645, partial [Armatimonadetes bacterium]|nr:hypothetical protein [Armatimonadota bacterium]